MKTIYFNNETITAEQRTNIVMMIADIRTLRFREPKNNIKYHEDEFLNMLYGWFDGVCYTEMLYFAKMCLGCWSPHTQQIKDMIEQAEQNERK